MPETVRAALTAEHAALLVQYPSFAGTIQDLAPLAAAAHDAGRARHLRNRPARLLPAHTSR